MGVRTGTILGQNVIDYDDGQGWREVDQNEWNVQSQQKAMVDDMNPAERFLVGAGKNFVDIGRGAQRLWHSSQGNDQQSLELAAEQAEANANYQAMTDFGGASEVVGQMAPAVLSSFLAPGAGFTGLAAQTGIGAGYGALMDPTGDDGGAFWGAASGFGGTVFGNMTNRVIASVGRNSRVARNTYNAEVLSRAERPEVGMQFTPGQKTGNRADLLMETKLRRSPAYAGVDAERIMDNQLRLNNQAAKTLGFDDAAKVTGDMQAKVADEVGAAFDAIGNVSDDIPMNPEIFEEVIDELGPAGTALFDDLVAKHPKLLSRHDAMTGKEFNLARNYLAKKLRAKSNVLTGASDEGSAIMGAMDDALESANPELAEAVGAARKKWKALLVVEGSQRGAQTAASGDISAAGAFQALKKYDKGGFFRERTKGDPFYDAVRAMANSMDRVPPTGTLPPFAGGLMESLIKKPLAESYMKGNPMARLLMGLTEGATPNVGRYSQTGAALAGGIDAQSDKPDTDSILGLMEGLLSDVVGAAQ